MSDLLREKRGALDELRGLAICAVLASHVALVFRSNVELARVLLVPALGVGVDLFFVISGFLIVERAARSTAKAGEFWCGAAAFWAGRVIRIGVPAWVTIAALFVAWRLGVAQGLRVEDLIAAGTFVGNFYWAPCFAGVEGCGDPLLSSHFWSLGIEAQFYALAPFLAALGRRSIWIIVSLALVAGAMAWRPWGGFWWALRVDALLVGVLIGMETRWRADWLTRVPKIGLELATYWLLVAAMLARVLSNGVSGVGLVMVALIFGAVLAGRRRDVVAREPLGGRLLRWIGERSYSIYLVHLPILSTLRPVLLEHAPGWVAAAIATTGVLIAALYLEQWVTGPSKILARRVAARICEATKASLPVEGANG